MHRQSEGALYSLARDIITEQMSLLSSQLWRERNKADRDDALCLKIQAQNTQLFLERDSLCSTDRAALESCIRKYARSPTGADEALAAIDELRNHEHQ